MSRRDSVLSMRLILIRRRDSLRRALAGDMDLLERIRTQSVDDVVDQALDAASEDVSSRLVEVETSELRNVESALERMQNGNFGVCQGCGSQIPMARLNCVPYATHCVRCQREVERRVLPLLNEVGG